MARLARAESTRRIHRALDDASSPSAFAEFSRFERKVERNEALADAYDRLAGRDPAEEELEAEYEEKDREERVAAELDGLRKRLEEEDPAAPQSER